MRQRRFPWRKCLQSYWPALRAAFLDITAALVVYGYLGLKPEQRAEIRGELRWFSTELAPVLHHIHSGLRGEILIASGSGRGGSAGCSYRAGVACGETSPQAWHRTPFATT
jgi:hypothetical protein